MARDSALLSQILAIVIRVIAGSQRRRAEARSFTGGESGSVTLVQRFGGSANLNLHFHTLMIESVYGDRGERADFHALPAPSNDEVKEVLAKIQSRVVRCLRRAGYLDSESLPARRDSLNDELEAELFELCQGASIQSRIALVERAGKRVRKIGSFGLEGEAVLEDGPRCASLGGFSIHANTAVAPFEKDRLEKLCRYVARPSIAEMRLTEAQGGGIIYRFKRPWADGTQASTCHLLVRLGGANQRFQQEGLIDPHRTGDSSFNQDTPCVYLTARRPAD